jgi:hypothetical protein
MLYQVTLVVIDRPFTYGRSDSLPGLTNADIDDSHRASTDAAVTIVDPLQTYRHLYGLRQMNILTVHLVFTAALVHIHNVYFAPGDPTRIAARKRLAAIRVYILISLMLFDHDMMIQSVTVVKA